MSTPHSTERRAHVLVPGAGHGGWAWQPVAERLCAAGHIALSVTLPGMTPCADRSGLTLRDATRHVIAEIDTLEADGVVLVGHSLGGLVIATVAAELGPRVKEMIFVSAWVPGPGEAFADANDAAASTRYLSGPSKADGSEIPFELFASSLMQGLPESAQRIVHNLLTPTPMRYMLDPYRGPELTTLNIPSRYVFGADDHALVSPPAESASRLGVEPTAVPGTHELLLTHPDELARAILVRRPS